MQNDGGSNVVARTAGGGQCDKSDGGAANDATQSTRLGGKFHNESRQRMMGGG